MNVHGLSKGEGYDDMSMVTFYNCGELKNISDCTTWATSAEDYICFLCLLSKIKCGICSYQFDLRDETGVCFVTSLQRPGITVFPEMLQLLFAIALNSCLW